MIDLTHYDGYLANNLRPVCGPEAVGFVSAVPSLIDCPACVWWLAGRDVDLTIEHGILITGHAQEPGITYVAGKKPPWSKEA